MKYIKLAIHRRYLSPDHYWESDYCGGHIHKIKGADTHSLFLTSPLRTCTLSQNVGDETLTNTLHKHTKIGLKER